MAESPPGPPVRQTLVAEVYGPDHATQIAVVEKIRTLFHATPGVVDIDWSVEAPQPTQRFTINTEKAALHGIASDRVVQTLQVAVSGTVAGFFHLADEREPVPLFVQVPFAERAAITRLTNLKLASTTGQMVPLAELVQVEASTEPPFIYRKNQQRVVYVLADTAGVEDSPLYTIFQLNEALQRTVQINGAAPPIFLTRQPFLTEEVAMKWDGEWQVTYEFLRDVLFAFVAVLILIYMLLVGWFHSFKTPLVILTPIPWSLIGILPAHALIGAFLSGTSVIGFMAGAGIVVRNSIILVDFAELRRRQGMTLLAAVVDAGAVRFRPMLLTAASVVVGTAVILFDPIFQGLAVSLMAGEVASTFLSRLAVPVLYYLSECRQEQERGARVSTSDFTSGLAPTLPSDL